MKAILTILALLNLNTLDTHSASYEPLTIDLYGHNYKIEEDYSVSYDFSKSDQKLKIGENFYIVEEDFSLSKVK